MVGEEFLDRLDFYKSSWLPAREVVEEAVKKRHQVRSCPFCFILFVSFICLHQQQWASYYSHGYLVHGGSSLCRDAQMSLSPSTSSCSSRGTLRC